MKNKKDSRISLPKKTWDSTQVWFSFFPGDFLSNQSHVIHLIKCQQMLWSNGNLDSFNWKEWFRTGTVLNITLMPYPFTGPKMFCAGPNFLSQPKHLTAFSASSKTFVPAQKHFYWMQIIFLSGTKCLWLTQYVNKFLLWHKKFGPAQNILGPVKGQGIKVTSKSWS